MTYHVRIAPNNQEVTAAWLFNEVTADCWRTTTTC